MMVLSPLRAPKVLMKLNRASLRTPKSPTSTAPVNILNPTNSIGQSHLRSPMASEEDQEISPTLKEFNIYLCHEFMRSKDLAIKYPFTKLVASHLASSLLKQQ